MYWLNKIVRCVVNPATVCLLILFAAFLVRRFRIALLVFGLTWFWFWSSPLATRIIGVPLEEDYLVGESYPQVAAFPVCDAIVDMGGGVGGNTNRYNHALLNSSADRAYFSALLWKAGKAPIIIPSGKGLDQADPLFLLDLGVPDSAIVVENEAMNTEQNAKFVQRMLKDRFGQRSQVLLVTSAWHMKRTVLMFEKYAPELDVIPAACDFECVPNGAFSLMELVPNPETFARNSVYFHEWLGYWWYKYFRK